MEPVRILTSLTWLCLATGAAGRSADALQQQVVFRRVVLEGDPAPGMPGLAFGEIGAPAAFGELAALPSIDGSGHVALHAFAGRNPTLSSPRGMWREHQGSLTLVARNGDPAPGTPFVFAGFTVAGSTPMSGQGAVTIFGSVVNEENQFQIGLWSDRFGPLELVLFDTDHLPGTPPDTNVFDWTSAMRGQHVLIDARYESGPFVGFDHEGIWRDSTGDFEVVVVDGMPAPGFPAGAMFGSDDSITFNHPIHFWDANANGAVVFNAYAEGGGVSTMGFDDEGIWVDDASGLRLIVREGDPAPAVGASAVFGAANGIDSFGNQDFTRPDLPVAIGPTDAIVFGASVREPGYNRRPTVWTDRSGPLELLLRGSTDSEPGPPDGSPAPGYPAGSRILDFAGCFARLNAAGEIALTALVITTVGSPTITRAIFWDRPGTLALVARDDGAVPGVPGASFGSVQLSTFSDAGVLWYSGVLQGPGIDASNDFAAFVVTASGAGRLALREGDAFDVAGDGSDVRTVSTFGIGPGQTPAGERVFEILFNDGTHGVFTARPANGPRRLRQVSLER